MVRRQVCIKNQEPSMGPPAGGGNHPRIRSAARTCMPSILDRCSSAVRAHPILTGFAFCAAAAAAFALVKVFSQPSPPAMASGGAVAPVACTHAGGDCACVKAEPARRAPTAPGAGPVAKKLAAGESAWLCTCGESKTVSQMPPASCKPAKAARAARRQSKWVDMTFHFISLHYSPLATTVPTVRWLPQGLQCRQRHQFPPSAVQEREGGGGDGL